MEHPRTTNRTLATALLAMTAAAALALLALAPEAERGALTDDERDYLRAAAHLAHDGVLSFAPLGRGEPRPSAYREPGYPTLLALSLRALAVPLPDGEADLERLPASARSVRALRLLGAFLLAVAAGACGWGVARMGGAPAGALAAALVVASPSLRQRSSLAMSELLLAALLALATAACVAWWGGSRRAALVGVVSISLLPLVRAECVVLIALPALLAAFRGEGGSVRRVRRALVVAGVALLPTLAWMERNRETVGHFTLGDRSGLALAVRAALDEDVARTGLVRPLLAWTPSERARRLARTTAGGVDYLAYEWSGEGNYFTRTVRAWSAERARPGADPLAVDAAYRRASLHRFASHPLDHLSASLAVAWRGQFAERSPAWTHPLELGLPLGLLLMTAVAWVTGRAVAGRDVARLVFVAPAWALFLLHAGTSEFLPRYGEPLLPLAWSVLALAALGRRRTEGASAH